MSPATDLWASSLRRTLVLMLFYSAIRIKPDCMHSFTVFITDPVHENSGFFLCPEPFAAQK